MLPPSNQEEPFLWDEPINAQTKCKDKAYQNISFYLLVEKNNKNYLYFE